jgi:hypothetical protein
MKAAILVKAYDMLEVHFERLARSNYDLFLTCSRLVLGLRVLIPWPQCERQSALRTSSKLRVTCMELTPSK